MSKIKENPIKYVRLFSLLYLATNIITRLFYYIIFAIPLNVPIFLLVIAIEIIGSAPIILFIIYLFKFYGTNKSQILLPISYIVSITMNLLNLIGNLDDAKSVIFGVVHFGISVFLVVDCFLGFKRLNVSKKLVIIGAGISCFSILLNFIISVLQDYGLYSFNVESWLIMIDFTGVFSMLAHIFFWNFAIDKKNTLSLEYNLVSIKKQFENGEITEEDFNKRKMEILNNL